MIFFVWNQTSFIYQLGRKERDEPSLQEMKGAVAREWAMELPDSLVKENDKFSNRERKLRTASRIAPKEIRELELEER